MSRFLFFIIDLQGGGAERITLTLTQALHRAGHDVHLMTVRDWADYPAPENIPVTTLLAPHERPGRAFWRNWRYSRRLRRRVAELEREGPFDLVVSSLMVADGLMKRIRHPRAVYHIHCPLSQELHYAERKSPAKAKRWHRRYKRIYDGSSLLCVTPGLDEDLREGCGFDFRRSYQLPNTVDDGLVGMLAGKRNANVPDEPFLIHVARSAPLKRHDLLLEGFMRSGVSHKLVLLGKMEDFVVDEIRKRGLEKQVIIPGFQVNPYPWIKAADALLVTSDYEGMPMVILEALACGTPVISTDTPAGGVRQLMRGGLERFLFPVGDADALAVRIREVIASPPEIRSETLDGFRTGDAVAKLEELAALPEL